MRGSVKKIQTLKIRATLMYIPVLFPVSLVISDDSSLVSVRLADS